MGLSGISTQATQTINNFVQQLHTQSNNVSYLVRGVERGVSAPSDRTADYGFRDFYMTIVSTLFMELAFAMTDQFLTIPQLTKIMRLNKLEEFGGKNEYNKKCEGVKNWDRLPPELQSRMLGGQDKTYPLVPKLLEQDHAKAVDEAKKKGVQTKEIEALEAQQKVLQNHVTRILNFDDYLDERMKTDLGLSTEQQKQLKELVTHKDISLDKLLEQLNNERTEKLAQITHETFDHENHASVEKALKNLLKIDTIPEDLKEFGKNAVQFAKDKLYADFAKGEFKNFLGKVFWPKNILNTGLSFLYYGMFATWFDNNVLQPWQKKQVEKYGDAQFVIKPSLVALPVGGAALFGLMKLLPSKLGHLGKLAIAAPTSLAVYTGLMMGMIHQTLKNKPVLSKEAEVTADAQPVAEATAPQVNQFQLNQFQAAVRHAQAFRPFEANSPA